MAEALYSIVVPVYKSQDSLRELYDRIDKTFENIDGDYELILVEDCGRDNSWQVMKSLRELNNKVKIIKLTKNFGQHNALMCGFSFASGEYIITLDDDLQNPPEEIPKLIDALAGSQLDVVYGVPKTKKQSLLRNAGSFLFLRLISLIFREIPHLKLTNFRIIRKYVVEHILRIYTPNPLVGLLILKVTDKTGTVTVDHHERTHGKTTYSMAKLLTHFAHGILYNSTLPLKAVFILGIACLCLCVALGAYYLIAYLTGAITVSGWTTLVLLILFFSGIIMFSMGVVGEYLLRIIQEVYRTPQYVIRDKEV
ncbi:MAG: glycosyltransferase family 2 protein [Planctomycetota bacterium]|jgi:dolichol-phosphate mannosyltransferase/undecaprenyl-phosphate 4-deoxy-4-formamido-L-arabinose transferase